MNTNKLEAQAAAWLIRCEAPDCSADDRAKLEEWLDANPRHRAVYLRLRAAWTQAERFRRLRPLDGAVNENLLTDSILPSLRGSDREDFSRQEAWPARRFAFAAAVAVVLLVIGLAARVLAQRSDWQTYDTDFGGFERVVLRDGSVVHMNTKSRVRVHFTQNRRDVVLESGEALFKVAHETQRPFQVVAGKTTVRAVGTEFSIRMENAKHVEVIVTEGRVAIDPPKRPVDRVAALPPSMSTLSAGETVTITASQLHVEKIASDDVTRKLGWVEGRLWLNGQTLVEAVEEFNRYNHRQMVVADPAIAGLRLGGGFESTDPESFMAALEQQFGIRAFPSASGEVVRLVGTRNDKR